MKNNNIEINQENHNQVNQSLKVLVVGATGGTGRAAVEELIHKGHSVTAFSRTATRLDIASDRLTCINGDAADYQSIEKAVIGQDVVIVTLGISENPLSVRFFGAAQTANNVRSLGTENIIQAMQNHGVNRLVVQSSFGVGETRDLLSCIDRLFLKLILKPQIADTEIQENFVRNSGLDWVLVQPVHLSDENSEKPPFMSVSGQVRAMKVTRKSVAQFLATAVHNQSYTGKSVAISG